MKSLADVYLIILDEILLQLQEKLPEKLKHIKRKPTEPFYSELGVFVRKTGICVHISIDTKHIVMTSEEYDAIIADEEEE